MDDAKEAFINQFGGCLVRFLNPEEIEILNEVFYTSIQDKDSEFFGGISFGNFAKLPVGAVLLIMGLIAPVSAPVFLGATQISGAGVIYNGSSNIVDQYNHKKEMIDSEATRSATQLLRKIVEFRFEN